MYINLFDSHVHSDNSPEGRDLVTALCSAAVDKGISGICITDACDMEEFEEQKYGKRLMYSALLPIRHRIFSPSSSLSPTVWRCASPWLTPTGRYR